MAVVFYAGHGMGVGGENWLIPTDAELRSDAFTKKRLLALAEAYDAKLGRPSIASRQLPLVSIDGHLHHDDGGRD